MKTLKVLLLIIGTLVGLAIFSHLSIIISDLSVQREHLIELENRVQYLEKNDSLKPVDYLEYRS